MELPSTHGALVEDRSGLAVRGMTTLAGVIDPGYRGELKIVLTNLTSEPQMVAPGHRIAQLRIVERIQAVFEETDMLAEALRGVAGFGSTGVRGRFGARIAGESGGNVCRRGRRRLSMRKAEPL